MTDGIYFPKLNEKNIKIVAKLYEENEGFFEQEGCPYSPETIKIFKMKDAAPDFDKTAIEFVEALEHDGEKLSEMDVDQVISEVDGLWAQLKQQGNDMQTSDNASERNTYFRLSVTLLEKVMALKEKAFNQKKMFAFTHAVLTVMEEEMSPDQRTAVMTKLRSVLDDPE